MGAGRDKSIAVGQNREASNGSNVGDVLRLVVSGSVGRDNEKPSAADVVTRNVELAAVVAPLDAGGGLVPVASKESDVTSLDIGNVELGPVRFVVNAVHLVVCDSLASRRPNGGRRRSLCLFRSLAAGAVELLRHGRTIVRDQVDVAGGEVGLGKFRSLGHEDNLAAIGGEVVVLRATEGLVRSLRAGDRSIDAEKEVGEVASKAEAGVALGEGTGEDRVALLGHIGVPVTDPDVVVKTTAGGRSAGKLLVVSRSVVSVCLGVDDEVDSAGRGGGSLETREGSCEASDLSSVVC